MCIPRGGGPACRSSNQGLRDYYIKSSIAHIMIQGRRPFSITLIPKRQGCRIREVYHTSGCYECGSYPANRNQREELFHGVYTLKLYWYRLELSVTTTYLTSPTSSLHGVQCVKNLSSPRRARDRRVKRLMLAEIAWPPFSASLTLDLNSRGKEVVYWAKNLKMLFPMKSLLVLLVMPRTSTMPCE